jgi:F-type H+-transporting ATPase subunit delta
MASTSNQSDALAQVYARSLFQLAQEAGGREKIEEVNDELEQICELMRSDRRLREFLASPIIDEDKRKGSLQRVFENRVTDLTLRFLLVLNDRKRLGHLEAISDAFSHLVQEAFGRVEVDVFTATPLEPDQRARLTDRIREALGREPVLHPYTDPSLIGGIRLRVGDQLIDGSVVSSLRKLRQTLLTSGGAALRGRIAGLIDEGRAS